MSDKYDGVRPLMDGQRHNDRVTMNEHQDGLRYGMNENSRMKGMPPEYMLIETSYGGHFVGFPDWNNVFKLHLM